MIMIKTQLRLCVLLSVVFLITGSDSKDSGITKVLTLRKTLHSGIPKFPLLGTFRDPYIGGFYYTTIKLGSPPRKFHVQIDTGSNDLWVNCQQCTNCPTKSKLGFRPNHFIPEKSSSLRLLDCLDSDCVATLGGHCTDESHECGFSRLYWDGRGVYGIYIYDLIEFDVLMPSSPVTVTTNTSGRILFGCSVHVYGGLTHENQSIDGILGLGKLFPSPLLQVAAQVMIPPIFYHCLGGDGNGTLVLGEFDSHAATSSIVYTPLLPGTRYYNLDLKFISVGGKQLGINPIVFNTSDVSGTIVDSGTSVAYLVAEAYDVFIIAMNAAVAKYAAPIHFGGTICYKISISHIDRFPLLSFNFGNTSMNLNPQDYILRHRPIIDDSPALCIGILKSTMDNFTILGDLVLKDKIIIYDIHRQRLGWSGYYNCSEGMVKVSESRDVAGSITMIRNLMIYVLYMILIII